MRPTILDYINLTLAFIAWLAPDIPLLYKILVSAVLLGIFLISLLKPNFVINIWSPLYYLVVLMIPIAIAIVEWWIALNISMQALGYKNYDISGVALQFGIGFGVIIGLPITLIGAQVVRSNKSLLSYRSLRVGCAGCVLQIAVIFGLLASGLIQKMPEKWVSSFLGIIGPGAALLFLLNRNKVDNSFTLTITDLISMGAIFLVSSIIINLLFFWLGKKLAEFRNFNFR